MCDAPPMYSQLQNWSSAGAPPCMEPISGPQVPSRIGQMYQTPKNHPWRPTLGYENVEVTPLGSQPTTNMMMDPCYTQQGMATEPLKFPNLVTGFERNPANAARAALYTRFTPYEWSQSNLTHFNEADTNRNYSERMRADACRIMRETDEVTTAGQRDAGRRIGERLTDLSFWRSEVANELEKLITETNLQQDTRRSLEKSIQDLEAPLHIAQECLYQRENRQGIDLVHDSPEQSILKEIETLRSCQARLTNLLNRSRDQVEGIDLVHDEVEHGLLLEVEKLKNNLAKYQHMLDKVKQQLRNNRAAQQELERDLRFKETAIGIDNVVHSLNNFSRGINYYGGIEKYDNTIVSPEQWSEFSSKNVQRSQAERARSAQLRSDADNLINSVANETWTSWQATNSALERRSNEITEAKQKLQLHLHKIQQEIFDVEKNIELIRKSINDKSNPLKVAQTRLEARAHRQEIELCSDPAQARLIQEVKDLQSIVETLHRKLQEAEAQHQQLLKTKSNLETDLSIKVNSLFIDREKCMGMRRSYPITATIKY